MTKYIGPKTDGENVATQADKLSLSSETPDALTPDQTGAAGTATTAARSDHQHEILAGAAGTITGTNAEGTSTSFARADHDHALSSALSNALAPTGSIMAFAGTVAPTGWLLCDGSQQPVATYGALDAVLGTTYGNRTNGSGGSGSSHFRLPDLRGRVPAGKDDMGGSAASRLTTKVLSAANTLGATGGAQTHTLTTSEMPAHDHDRAGALFNFTGGGGLARGMSDKNLGTSNVRTQDTGGGGEHTNTQPTLVLNYIIKT